MADNTNPTEDRPAEQEESIIEKVQHAAADAVESARETASDAVESVRETASDLAGRAADAVKHAAADVAHAVADVAEAVADRIEGDGNVDDEIPLTAFDSVQELEPPKGKLGYTGEITGRVITLAELEAYENRKDPDEPVEKDEDFLAMVEGSFSEVEEGEVVTGTIVSLGEKDVVIDFGFKSNGIVSRNEFEEDLAVGDEVQVFLERKEDRQGQPVVSRAKAHEVQRWQRIEDAFENEGVLEGTIIRRIKGGMIVDLLGAEAFLPGSQVDVRPVRDFDVYLNRTMEFKVVKLNPANGNVVISHKALIEKDLLAQRQQILDQLEVGQVLEGQVKNIVDFGVFIDLGGVDGLLHITDLSWGRVGHPSEVVELDQKLNIVVLDYDRERQRISLGLKQLQPHPWDNIEERYVENQVVEGRVVSITDYGAFVELEKGIEGLVHISEMSYTEHIKHPTQKVQLGQMVQVRILNVDTDAKKISLGMKQLESDPWEGMIERYTIGDTLTGRVRNITSFGAFVEIEPGIDGLVHVSDLSWTKRVKHPSEVVRKGQELKVVMLDIDVAQRRLSLGHKQVETDPWQQYVTAFPVDTDIQATVAEVSAEGIRVDLPLDAPGFIPSSHLDRTGDPRDAYEMGEALEVRVLRLDHQSRDIILSETARRRAAERAERDAERAEKDQVRREERQTVTEFQKRSTGPATIGELSGLQALKAQMEAQEAAASSEPQREEPIETIGKANTAVAGKVGEGNRGVAGERMDETEVSNDAGPGTGVDQGHATGQEPPAEQQQRRDEGGDTTSAQDSQAALKSGFDPEPGTLAAQGEQAADREHPTRDHALEPQYEGPNVETPADAQVELKPGPDAPDEDATELGKASADVQGDLDEAAGESDEEQEEK